MHVLKMVMAVLLGLLTVGATPMWAQNRPCLADLQKHCPAAKPGTPEAMQCLNDHKAELSAACQARMGASPAGGRMRRGSGIQSMLSDCREEITSHCKEVKPGGGRILACLKEHKDKLGAKCKAAVEAGPEVTPASGSARPSGATPPAASPGATPAAKE